MVISGQQEDTNPQNFSFNPHWFSHKFRSSLSFLAHGTVNAIGNRKLNVRLLIQDEGAQEGIEDDEFS